MLLIQSSAVGFRDRVRYACVFGFRYVAPLPWGWIVAVILDHVIDKRPAKLSIVCIHVIKHVLFLFREWFGSIPDCSYRGKSPLLEFVKDVWKDRPMIPCLGLIEHESFPVDSKHVPMGNICEVLDL